MKTIDLPASIQASIFVALFFCMPANALLISNFEFDIHTCTPTCDSLAALGVGGKIDGILSLSSLPGEDWSAADLVAFDSVWFDSSAPLMGFTGDNVTTANPLPVGLERLTIGSGPIGPDGLTTGGTSTTAGLIDSGILLFELDSPPFNSVGSWLIIRIESVSEATIELCLFYATAGCIDNATRAVVGEGCINTTPEGCRTTAVPLPPAIWLLGASLLLLPPRQRYRVPL